MIDDDARALHESITDEQKARWEAAQTEPWPEEVPKDQMYSERWLSGSLLANNCPSDVAARICFAVGQRQAHQTTATGRWGCSLTALRNYVDHGTWEEPGSELAMKLLKENFGDPLDPIRILDWLSSRPSGRKVLARSILDLMEGRMPPLPKTPWEE